MIKITKKKKCNGCYSCINACPKNCIKMQIDDEGFEYPVVDEVKCVHCGICDKVCPELNKPKESEKIQDIYVGYALDKDLVLKSSSGGVFALLAMETLQKQGVVFGVTIDENVAKHIFIEDISELDRILKSKYVQSKVGNSYSQAKQFLEKKREVLFCGTPCQIAGLKKYLNKDYENLICVDFICHGVPSQKVLDSYLHYVTDINQEDSEIIDVKFRTKTAGWENYGILTTFASNKTYEQTGIKDFYFKGFLNDITLRPSCYYCGFKGINRCSDITLADAWGVNYYNKEMYNKDGVSLVIIQTKKGKKIFDRITKNLRLDNVEEEFIKKRNVNAYYPVIMDYRRRRFFKLLRRGESFDKCIEKTVNINIDVKIQRKIKKIILNKRIKI